MTETLRNAGKPGVDENDGTVVGVILAGGLSRRMGGGDKCLHPLAGRPMLDHVIDRFAPQVSRLALNANGDPARFAAWPLPVIPDIIKGHAGPLAGVLTAMAWAKQSSPSVQWVATVAADTPFLPADLVSSLMSAANKESSRSRLRGLPGDITRYSDFGTLVYLRTYIWPSSRKACGKWIHGLLAMELRRLASPRPVATHFSMSTHRTT